ncbi:ketoacyl-ACP synthase III [Acinetobacter pittii]|uniref:ketoacyl-ACP synthase III n=1 Tax=Acinetobacter pittii TaxID=48296 RepID=UPI0038926AE8
MKIKIEGVQVTNIYSVLPPNIEEFENLSDTYPIKDINRIINSTGIKSIYKSEKETTSDLCLEAAIGLLEKANIEKNTIDAIIVVTQTPDDLMPGTACGIHGKLNLSEDCIALDINYGCTGFIFGLFQSAMLLKNTELRKILLITGDNTTKLIDKEDRSTRFLFGDAASATIIEKGTDNIFFNIKTYGNGRDSLYTPFIDFENKKIVGNIKMNGPDVLSFALNEVPKSIEELLNFSGYNKKDINLFGLHQANKFMVNTLRKIIDVDKEKVPIKMEKTGNTGPTAIPLLLSILNHEDYKFNEKNILCGFGVGLSTASAIVNLSNTKFYQIKNFK